MTRPAIIIALIVMIIAGFRLAGSGGSDVSDQGDTNRILENATFRGLDGGEVTLEDFRGKTILIDIWETWCTPCLISMPTLQQLMDDYPDDFVVLAVSPGYLDSPEQVHEFVDRHDYDFVFVFGEELARNLGVHSLPFKVYVSPNGEYIQSVLGSQGPQEDYEKTREIIETFL